MHEAAITMPKLSMTMEEGELVEWEVREGDPVAAGDVVCRVMTDKTEMDVEAPAAGTLVRVVVGAGESVEVGTTLAFLSTEDRDMLEGMFDDPAPAPVAVPQAASDSPAEGAQPVTQAKVAAPAAGREVVSPPLSAAPLSAVRVRSVPAARALAGSLGVDLRTVPCPDGKIVTVEDVLAWSRSGPGSDQPAAHRRTAPAASPAAGDEPLRGRAASLARATAKTMGASAEVPQFTLNRALDLAYASAHRGPVSWNAVLIAAAARALRSCPRINGTWTGHDVVLRSRVVLGVAVATNDGLVVCSLPDADQMALSTLADSVAGAVERARANQMVGDDLLEPTFTVSNLGGLGVDWFAALVTPPQAAVLSLGRVRKSFEATGDGFALRTQCIAGLTVDHRVANGADGARYLAAVNDQLQQDAFVQLALGTVRR